MTAKFTTKPWHFFLAGDVERGPKHEWHEGYSPAEAFTTQYPWITKREAQAAARHAGARAVFHKTLAAARAAIAKARNE